MDYFYLALHLVLPLAVPVFVMLLCASGSFQDRLGDLFSLRSNESLIRQKLFWLSLVVPFGLFFSFGFICWKGYRLELSQEGISLFLNISTFPLTLLSAAIPLGVVVASFHSTQQTAEQIKQAGVKNNLEAYYLHRTEFFKHFERHGAVSYLGVVEGKFIPHALLYNNCSPGDPEFGVPKRNEYYFMQIDAAFSSAATFMHIVFTKPYSEWVFSAYLMNACVSMHAVGRLLGLSELYRDMVGNSLVVEVPVQSGKESENYMTVGRTATDFIAIFRYARDFYVNLSAFYGYECPDLPDDVKYLGSGGKVFTLPGWSNVAKFREDLLGNYDGRNGFKVSKPSDLILEEVGVSE